MRSLGEAASRARLELLDDDLALVGGELRTFDVEVRNLGCEVWPGGTDAHPPSGSRDPPPPDSM